MTTAQHPDSESAAVTPPPVEMTRRLLTFLFRVGSDNERLLLQPMSGTPENLRRLGDAFWIRRDVVAAIVGGVQVTDGPPRTVAETGITCKSRMDQPGPWEHEEGLDAWDKVGADRVCSFCGSMHPDDLRAQLTNPQARIEISDKRYKVYIHRPNIINASFGAIKFYTWHGDQTLIDAINARARLIPAQCMEILVGGTAPRSVVLTGADMAVGEIPPFPAEVERFRPAHENLPDEWGLTVEYRRELGETNETMRAFQSELAQRLIADAEATLSEGGRVQRFEVHAKIPSDFGRSHAMRWFRTRAMDLLEEFTPELLEPGRYRLAPARDYFIVGRCDGSPRHMADEAA